MSFLSSVGGLSVASLITEGAAAVATGGTSLALQGALKGAALAIGDEVLQGAGAALGLPSSVIDLAQAAFHTAAGDPGGAYQNIQQASQSLGSAAGLDSSGQGQIQQQSYDAVQNLLNQVLDQMKQGKDADGNNATAAAGGKGGQSFLVAFAEAMGKAVDDKMDDMLGLAKNIDQANSSGDKSQLTQMTAQMQAMSQEVSMMSTAMSTSIKSIGDAISQLARKD